jgi:malate synthase
MTDKIQMRAGLKREYADVLTAEALDAVAALAPLNRAIKDVMRRRMQRRSARALARERIGFLDPSGTIAGTDITVRAARAGDFEGSPIPSDLERQWIQGTGPAAKPHHTLERSIRNVAYALLSGADGWMFDGEDALGQTQAMSLDNQRNLKLAISRDDRFMQAARGVAAEMNGWAESFLGRAVVGARRSSTRHARRWS